MIKLANLSKYYYSGNTVALGLRKVNLEFGEKEFVVITGESGSGKTTLLSTISGLLPYEEGELYVEGKPTSHFEDDDWENYRKEHIAFVFQNYNLIDSYTVLENVMTVLLIQGIHKKAAKATALEYLEKVGLTDYITHHASELSSGQKQRLSIARALAKNTKIIVADEPTGNLDAENGKQVMELLSKLAEDRLVLVVTHNYEEAAPFATRKVRIYDGEVVEDIYLKQREVAHKEEEKGEAEVCKEESGVETKTLKSAKALLSPRKISRIFTGLEIAARKRKGVLFTSLLLFVAMAAFIFMGNVLANMDDTSTRNYTNEAFANIDPCRIAIRHRDGSAITDQDIAVFKQIKNIAGVEQYGQSNDINYFCEEGVDYLTYYNQTNAGFKDETPPEFATSIYLKEYNKYFRSASGLTQNDLAYGKLPETVNEVVVYSQDPSVIGTTCTYFFADKQNWMLNTYCRLEMTICGILKEETPQSYFSEELARVLCYNSDETIVGYYNFNSFSVHKDENGNTSVSYYGFSTKNHIMIYLDDTVEFENDYNYGVALSSALIGKRDVISAFMLGMYIMDDESKHEYEYEGHEIFFFPYRDQIAIDYLVNLEEGKFEIAEKAHLSGKEFMVVTRDIFNVLAGDYNTVQANIYVTDYAYVDDVLKQLHAAGYDAISPYRVGAISYDQDKVMERLTTMGLSLAALLVLFVLEVFILKALLKNGKNDCFILKSIGMEHQVLAGVQRNTLLFYSTIAFVIMVAVAFVLNHYVPQVHALMVYYRIQHWALLLGLNWGAVLITAWTHNRYLKQLLVAGIE